MVKAVETYFAAMTEGDADAFVSVFADDGVSHDPLGAPERRGHAELRRMFEGTQQYWDELHVTLVETFVAGDGAAARWTATGSRAGVDVTYDGIDVFAFDADGRVAEVTAYWDLDRVLRQMEA